MSTGLSSRRDPATNYKTYTASDSVPFTEKSREILVCSGGVVRLWKPDDTTEDTPELPAGTTLKVVAKGIKAAGTTASGFFVYH